MAWYQKNSDFIRERSLSIEDRLSKCTRNSNQPKIVELVRQSNPLSKTPEVEIDCPLFEPLPSEIVLQTFEPFRTYEIIVSFRNHDKVARRLLLEPIQHPHFSITGLKSASLQSGKIAPGMEVQFMLKFLPEENIDYSYNLVCITEREKFLLPIRAFGARGLLDFPDEVNFSDCPVRFVSTKTLLVRNIGNRHAKFVIEVDNPFEAVPRCGFLEVGKNMQIDLQFRPEASNSFQNRMLVRYDTGETVCIIVRGNAADAQIRLDKNNLKMDSTYITKSSLKTIRIWNHSEIMATFCWKTFGTPTEERQHRLQKKLELDHLEENETAEFIEKMAGNKSVDLCDLAPLVQKFKNRRREIVSDNLIFQKRAFQIQPVEGIIWPNAFVDVNIVFSPKDAGLAEDCAYCEVSGRETRLPLYVKGEGIGPKARFSYDMLDLDEVFINTGHCYEVILENKGDIDFHYSIEKPSTMFGPKFQFSPESGLLKPGKQHAISIQFNSDILGSFLESFVWKIEGAPENLSLTVKGNVVGPTFQFECSELNFGQVAYGFSSCRRVDLVNFSHIPMEFVLHSPQTNVASRSDMRIIPEKGAITPKGRVTISIEFTPKCIQSYEEYVSVDVPGVGEDLYRLPVYADSVVPEISLRTPLLDFGDCYLGFNYKKYVELVNETEFPARYELLSQEESAKNVFAYSSSNGTGVIMPFASTQIQIDIQIKRLGQINFPVFVKIIGNEDLPLGVDISAIGIGPNVVLSATELNWGKIQVLKECVLSLVLANESPIHANFTCATVSDSSVFRVNPLAGTIVAGGSATVDVTAFLDDTLKFTDILKIGIQSDGIHEIQLVARGHGSTIIYDDALKYVDFEDVFSNRECSREFVLTNKGRRAQTLHWTAEEDRFARKDISAGYNQVFEVFPSRFVLKPNGQQVIVIKGYSNRAIRAKDTLICQATIDKDPARRNIVETTVVANFINPLLDISPPLLRFISARTRDDDFELLSQVLSLKNTSPLPLHLSFRCPIPYSVIPHEVSHRLNQGESVSVKVSYDPKYNINRVSCKDHAKLWITYSEHPQRDFVELFSEITFPNLTFSVSSLNFGCIPYDHEQKRYFTMTNCSSLPVEYSWSFLETMKDSPPSISISQVFDILPVRGVMQPGEQETVEITYFGYAGGAFQTTAICDVVGGPKYDISLKGEASIVEFTFDKTTLDFGTQYYQDILEQDIVLSNTGQVAFDFNAIIFDTSSIAQKIMVSPSCGTVQPHGKQKINVRFCPCVPEPVDDFFVVQLGLFEPIQIRVIGNGTFPHIQMSIQRLPDPAYESILTEVVQAQARAKRKHIGSHHQRHSNDGVMIESDLELEAERQLLKSKTAAFLQTFSEDLRTKIQPAAKSKMIGSTVLIHKSLQKQAKDKKNWVNISECSEVILANYVCNFGNVIKNTSRKKSFKLTNKSLNPISFQLDKSTLFGTGFSIEPDRVKQLPGHPSNESVEFQVTFQARTQNIGVVQVELPIKVQGGPTTMLTLRADVTLPDLQLSTNEVDFGEVLCGLRKTIAIQLSNKNSVPCEWTSLSVDNNVNEKTGNKQAPKKKSGVTSIKEFDLVPQSGMLQPSEKVLLHIRFSPTEEKDYDTFVPLKINMNGQPILLHLMGKGFKNSIIFEPETLTLGPILPCSEGTEAKFSIINPSNHPIEIYSLEFDHMYLEEEEILRNIDNYEGTALFLPVREPGQGLPDYIVEAGTLKMRLKSVVSHPAAPDPLLASKTTGQAEPGAVGELVDIPGRTSRSPGPTQQEPAADSSVNIILHGPPFSGKTTQAQLLQKTFGLAYIKIDDVIEDHFLSVENSRPSESPLRNNESSRIVVESVPEDRKENQASLPPSLEDDLLKLGDVGRHLQEEHKQLSDDVICDILRTRIHKEDCQKGVVIDGLDSNFYNSQLGLIKILLRVFGEKKKNMFFHINMDVPHIRERETLLLRAAGDFELDPSRVKDVTEEDYDNMSEKEKEQYDIAMMKCKKRFKELQDRRKLERKHWEEEMAIKLGERKAEEENAKGGKKKGGRRGVSRQSYVPDKPDKQALNAAGKPEGKSAGRSVGDKGGVTSPKTGRKLQSDKEKDGKLDKGDKGALQDQDDMQARFNATDVPEPFSSETTSRRYDAYTANFDTIVNFLREGDKPSANRQVPTSATMDKKTIRGSKGVGAPLTADSFAQNIAAAENDIHATEELPFISYHEVTASGESAETLGRVISDFIPSVPKLEEGTMVENIIPQPFLEQIVYYPNERELPVPSRYFVLLPPPSASDFEEEGGALNEAAATGAAKIEGAAQTNTGGASAANASAATGGPSSTANANSSTAQGSNPSGNMVNSGSRRKPTVKVAEDAKVSESEEDVEKESPSRYRWLIQPHERKELTVKFSSNEIGKFEQILQFEIVGSKVKYPILCVGHCRYAQIASDYRKIFPKWRKTKEDRYISHGEYIASSGMFEFGPLLYSKPREKYLEKFPENRAILNILNPSHQEIKVWIALRNDVKSEVFFFDPPTLDLAPGQSQNLFVWAYPRSANYFEDSLILCVKDNPEPYIYKVSCHGVKPELEIDKRQLSFDKLLLGRSEKREIKLRNNTLMPVAWKLAQVELLGDEFSVVPLEGVIEPFQEQAITAEFKGMKPVVISRRSIRLEVSDTEKIGGVVQEVPILVTAEAYDIAMDLHFPKGYEGGLDFGVLKVLEEGKQLCTLKNKGKYEVGYRFVFDSKDLAEIFTISPQQGIMQPSDKPFAVQVIFRANREMTVKDSTNLKCQFYEASTGEVTATIPIKLLARAVFSRFSILPVRDLNFGALVHGLRSTRQFTIENQGEFDFRYSIYKIIQGINEFKPSGMKLRTNSRASKAGRATSPPAQKVINKKELVKQADAASFGAFTVFPTNAIVQAGAKHQVTVEFHSDNPGSFEETVAIDISDRSPNDYMDVIEYRLIGESCIPGINTTDYASIFEEQTVCKRLELFNSQGSVFAEEDRVFYFGAFLAGQQAVVRFKMSNPYKVPCDVSLSTRPRSRTKSDAVDFAFDLEPKKMTIPSHEYRYVTVYFHPTSIQSYAGIFEAIVENLDQSKTKTLTFELRGEGTLPRIAIEKPTLKSKLGLPLLKFRPLLVGAKQTLSIVLKNDGITNAKVKLEWAAKELEEFDCIGLNILHSLRPQESRTIDVTYRAIAVRKSEADLKVRVIDNPFEDTMIQLSGEGYVDDITFDNLPGESENEVNLGDCYIGETKTANFTITNHSNDIVRVAWTCEIADLTLSPMISHIRAKDQKDFTVSFCAKQPVEFNHSKINCKINKIKYPNTSTEVDWDDKAKSVKWVVSDSKTPTPKKIMEQYPEPSFEMIPSNIADHFVLLKALADYSSYECDTSLVKFKTTFIYQSRIHRFNIRNTGKDTKTLSIKLSGASLRPFCHFELDDCDYISAERRNIDIDHNSGVPSILPPNTRVIEFGSCGIKVKNTKRFYIVNTTNLTYDFEWNTDSDQRVFRCVTPKGTVLPNKKFEIVFEFIPESVLLKESFWKFTIPGHDITIPFLLVGQALEPNVYIDRVSVNFKSVLVGRQVKETVKLINGEAIPFAYNFNETSFELGNDGTPVLNFSPTSGTIGGHSEVTIDILFSPSAEKMFNFNLICNVKKKPTPVTVNVKGEGYEIHDSLQTELADGSVCELAAGAQSENMIDFGQVQVNEKRLKRVIIVNSGKFNFDFGWKLHSKQSSFLSIFPDIGTVAKGERVTSDITFLPISNFSTLAHDFGAQFIYRPGMTPASTKLHVTNNDVREISFEVMPRDSSIFDITRGLVTLPPGDSSEIEITFYPMEAREYRDVIKIEVNGLSTIDIGVSGTGCDFKFDVVPEVKNINFGAIRATHTVSRSFKIINKSAIPATFMLGPAANIESLLNHSVILSNTGENTLRSKGALTVDLKFQPQSRIAPFAIDVTLESPGYSRPLFIVSGACQGIEIKLENDTLPFGAVVQRSCTTRRIQLQNTGDIGAKFKWEISKFLPDFSISPIEGYISPGMDVPLEVTFHPTEISQDIRYENLSCLIEGSSSLFLTLTGTCIPQPVQSDIIKFATPVRQSDVKSLKLENKTSMSWHIRPIFDNEYWSGAEFIDIDAGQSKSYDISFTPLEMQGAAVHNWMKRPQRFKVIMEVLKPDPAFILKGMDFIDVPPLMTREYKLNFYAYKEGVTNAKVIFRNEQTQEFLFYNLTFKSTPPGIISTLEMTTVVRQLCTKEIVVSNPLQTPVTFSAACNHPDVNIPHSLVVQSRTEGSCAVEYLPLHPKEAVTRLTLSSVELGVYQYDLKLNSSSAGPERSLHFKVSLGGSQTQTFRFLSFAKVKTEYTCKVDSPDFSAEKSVVAPAATTSGVEVSLDLTYEPSKLGDVRTQLLVSSSTGGDYVCPLYGHCIAPRPQGPISIKVGSTATVPFKNVFTTAATFTFVVDNPAFSVKAQETIGPKKVISMSITAHQPSGNSNGNFLHLLHLEAPLMQVPMTFPFQLRSNLELQFQIVTSNQITVPRISSPFCIEVPSTFQVKDLKAVLADHLPTKPGVPSQRLISLGRVLGDNETLEGIRQK
ncbi:hypothetical protein HDU76_012454, partial [Blyttiomyces sp. JEL0837]